MNKMSDTCKYSKQIGKTLRRCQTSSKQTPRRCQTSLLILFFPLFTSAQKVTYSPLVSDPVFTRFEVIGKAGDHYWIQKNDKRTPNRRSKLVSKDKQVSFEIYDNRYNYIRTVESRISQSTIREYYVPGNEYFDRLTFNQQNENTIARLVRYKPDGDTIIIKDSLALFPRALQASNTLMSRSEDKSKILLLGFVMETDSTGFMRSYLFDNNWNIIAQRDHRDRNIAQPVIQYAQIEYPLEHFTSHPLKVANTGEWFMICRSAATGKVLLFHFDGAGPGYLYQTIKAGNNIALDDVALSLSNQTQSVIGGVLVSGRNHAVKQVTNVHYSLAKCRIDFDSTYKFKTLAAKKILDQHIYEEYFITVPEKGFMFLKEYGRPVKYTDLSGKEIGTSFTGDDDLSPAEISRNDYTRYNTLAGTRSNFERGDLSLYFFPALPNDTCWSGILNKQQTDELNSANLSYVCMPIENKLVFLYNSLLKEYKLSSSTILDMKGNAQNEGVVFWRASNTLNFAKARQISTSELAIPYEKNKMNGFAIVKL